MVSNRITISCPFFYLLVAPAPNIPPPESFQVLRVIDGDTIEVEMDGDPYRVRYIGIDTPEKSDICYDTAKEANTRLVDGQTVKLVRDVSDTDNYGRLLRYVYVNDTFVNEVLIRTGLAENSVWEPDTRFC